MRKAMAAFAILLVVTLLVAGCAQPRKTAPADTSKASPEEKQSAPEEEPPAAETGNADETQPEEVTIDESDTQVSEEDEPQFEDLDVNFGDVY